jgi:hypothetical protein
MNVFDKKIAHILLSIVVCTSNITLQALTPTRVIVASDANPNYIQFWPIVAQAWRDIVGIRPTLALIAPDNVSVDESLGDVIRFAPIEGVSTALYAQCIRLLLPVLFPEDVCIISDMDIIPMQRKFFVNSIKNVAEDHFAVYRTKAILKYKQYPMCYVAAKGSVYGNIFNVNTIDDIPTIIQQWANLKKGWSTDQQLLYSYLHSWEYFKSHCDLLDIPINRIDRSKNSKYNETKLKNGSYTDYHCPRPYAKYKKVIDYIVAQATMVEQQKH